jgi:DnaJ-class molecular chaperone
MMGVINVARDPYAVLGINKSADEGDIRKAYRNMAKQYHPDRNPGDEKAELKFKEATAAHEILSDKEKRAAYDQGMMDADGNAKAHNPFGGGGGGNPFGGGFDDMGSVFEDLFTGGRRSRGPVKGQDVRSKLQVTFIEAANGVKKAVNLPDGGEINLGIPAGSLTGDTLRLKGKGSASHMGGPSGDLLVELVVQSHKYFKADGLNVHLELPITLREAVIGEKIDVPTLTGKVRLAIAPGTSSGKVFRLKGKGLKNKKSEASGDLLVKVMIVLDEETVESVKSIYEENNDTAEKSVRESFFA